MDSLDVILPSIEATYISSHVSNIAAIYAGVGVELEAVIGRNQASEAWHLYSEFLSAYLEKREEIVEKYFRSHYSDFLGNDYFKESVLNLESLLTTED